MKKTVTERDFLDAMNWDRYASKLLFEYLTDLEDDQGQEMELDGPAFMSEFSYYQGNDILDFMESLDEEDFAEWKEDEVDEDGDYDENSAIDFLENHGVSVAKLDHNEYSIDKKYTLIIYA